LAVISRGFKKTDDCDPVHVGFMKVNIHITICWILFVDSEFQQWFVNFYLSSFNTSWWTGHQSYGCWYCYYLWFRLGMYICTCWRPHCLQWLLWFPALCKQLILWSLQ